jgi:hypothetical protein
MKIILSALVVLAICSVTSAEARRVPICMYGSHPEGGLCIKNERDPYRCEWRFEQDNLNGTCSKLSDKEFNRRQADFENMDQDDQDRITKLDGDEDIERSIDYKNWKAQLESLHKDCSTLSCDMPKFQRIGGYKDPWENPYPPGYNSSCGPGNGDNCK